MNAIRATEGRDEQVSNGRNAAHQDMEAPWTGKYWNTRTPGVYRCAACGHALFSSEQKYPSGAGWASFWEPIEPESVSTRLAFSGGLVRNELRCGRCGSHLGHVFFDGPWPTGLRYSVNSSALELEPLKA